LYIIYISFINVCIASPRSTPTLIPTGCPKFPANFGTTMLYRDSRLKHGNLIRDGISKIRYIINDDLVQIL